MYHPCGEHRDAQCPASTYGCIPSSAENHDTRTEGVHTEVNTGVASGAQATRSSAARYCLLDKWQRENAPDTYEATFLQRQTSSPPAFSALFQPSSPSPENDACLECDETVNASYITFPSPSLFISITRCKILSFASLSATNLISARLERFVTIRREQSLSILTSFSINSGISSLARILSRTLHTNLHESRH